MNRRIAQRRFGPGLAIMIIALLALVALTSSSMNLNAQEGNWQAEYWNNRDLSGAPVLVRQESSINYDWGTGSPAPGVNADNFSAQWTETTNVPEGTYRFTATMDDGMRVFVDDVVVIDQWFDGEARTVTADVFLGAGTHTVRVQYFEAGGLAVARVNIALVSAPPPPPTTQAWRGEYFNNTNLAGTPALIRDDANINFNWGYGSPAPSIQDNFFSVRWTRTLTLEPGTYRFTTVTDDGVRLTVNGSQIINDWQVQAATAYSADITVPGGGTVVTMEYFENTQLAEARLTWTKLSGGNPTPPTGAWNASYFNNTNLSGAPVLTRSEQAINYDWGFGSPAPQVNVDNFSARWETTVAQPAGRYRFTVTSDDGVRVFVNGGIIIDAWQDQAVTTFTADVDLGSSPTTIRVEYFERFGLAEVSVGYNLVAGGGTGGQFPGSAVVTSYRLNVRTGPGTEFAIIAKLDNGQTVPLTGFRNGNGSWVQIALSSGATGWVSSTYITANVPIMNLIPITGTTPPPPSGGQPTGVVRAYWLNVRTGPSVNFPVITTVPGGTALSLIGRSQDSVWLKVILPDGRQGWVNGFYVETNVPPASLPVLAQ